MDRSAQFRAPTYRLAAEALQSHPVSAEVNGARNDGPRLIERYEDPQLGF